MQGNRRLLMLIGIALLASLIAAFHGLCVLAKSPSVADHLPADPLAAGVYSFDPAAKIDAWLKRVQAFSGEEIDPWAELDEKAGVSFRDDVLGAFGPEFGFAIDLPMSDPEQDASNLFGDRMADELMNHTILVAGIRDEARAIRALGTLVELAEAKLRIEKECLTIVIQESSASGGELMLHARVAGNLLILSGSADRLDEACKGFEQGRRLADGADFAEVATHVAADPDLLTYFNLPRIREWILKSGLDATMGRMQTLLTDEWMGVGLIYTSRRSGAGVEIAHFGPEATAEGLGMLLSGAYTMPVMLLSQLDVIGSDSAEDSSQTLASMRSIATALESYAIDEQGYPTTTGWEHVSAVRFHLEPAYIRRLPINDQWNQPLLYWSDGRSYRLVSRGSDAEVERDWTAEVESGAFSDSSSDIVFGDGQFLRWPEQ